MLDTLRTPATYGWKKWYFCAIPSHVIWPWRSDMESFYRSLCWYINNTKSALTWEIAITLYSTLSLLFLSANHTLGNLHPNSHGPWKGKHSTGQARIKDPDQTAAKIGEVSSKNVEGSWLLGGQWPFSLSFIFISDHITNLSFSSFLAFFSDFQTCFDEILQRVRS